MLAPSLSCFGRLFLSLVWLSFGSAVSVAAAPETTALPTPLVSPNDNRQYSAFSLANGLRVLLISDPQQDVAAASLSVSVGSFDDPASRPGLAHFLEHMLFLGTKRWPGPDDYNNFMAKHGGRHNAYTADDHTNYFFQTTPDAFGEALARFGQFFTAPLFNAIYVDKERNAVHSEYKLHLKDDRWRIHSAKQVAFNPEHPASRNYIGSLDTLSDEQGSVRTDLIDFYTRHYQASRMVLVLSAPHPLPRQQSWVHRHFGNIPGGTTNPNHVLAPMFKPDQLPALLDIRPQAELRRLDLSFPLPPTHLHYRTKPAQYIASLLGHEGEGSLYAYLKEKGWIETIITRAGNIWRQDASLEISIGLTPAGVENWQVVGDAVFAYIRLLKESDLNAKWRFAEESLLSNLAFRYNPRSQPIRYVAELSANAFDYPMIDVIRGPFLIDTYSPDVVSQYLNQLTPYRVLITRVAPELETDSLEPRFNVDYKLQPLDPGIQNRWASVAVSDMMRLPKKNEFLPKDLVLIDEPAASVPSLLKVGGASVWHSADNSFNIPEARLNFRLRNPDYAEMTVAQQAMLVLYLKLVDDALKTFSYPAYLAGLSYNLGGNTGNVSISISGYSDRQSVLLTKVMQAFTELEIAPERFAILKDSLIREWRNTLKQDPYVLAMRSLSNALQKQTYRPLRLAEALEAVTIEQLESWASLWRSRLGVSGLMVGNISKAQAGSLANIVTNALPNAVSDAAPNGDQLANLAEGGALRQEQIEHNDAALVVYVQGQGQSLTERAHYAVLSQILRTAYFNALRTEQQLGYNVSAFSRNWVDTTGIIFLVQSPIADANTLYHATTDFLDSFAEQLNRLYIRNLRNYKSAVTARLLEKDKNLGDRSLRYWSDLSKGKTNFDTRIKLAEAVKGITKKSLIATFNNFRLRFTHNTLIVYSKGKFDAGLNLSGLTLLTDEDFASLHNRENAFRYQPAP